MVVGQAQQLHSLPVRRKSAQDSTRIYICICRKFGQRKSWHLVGLVCTLVSFPFIFQPCIISAEAQAIYYAVLTVVYCFGWASQQVNKSGETWHNDKYFMYT